MTTVERPHMQFPFQRGPLPGPFKGQWAASGTNYDVGDIVQYAQAYYQAVMAWNAARQSNYGRMILEDNPVAYWRLGEPSSGRIAVDEQGLLAPNLITNPSFETDTAGWIVSGTTAVLSSTTTQHQFGIAAMQVVVSSGDNYGGTVYTVAPHTFKAGVSYWASFYVKGNAGGEVLQINMYDSGSLRQGIVPVTLTTSWQRISVQVTPAVDESHSYLYIRFLGAGFGTFFLDGVQITETPTLQPYYEGNGGNDGTYFNPAWTTNLYPNPRAVANVTNYTMTQGTVTQNLAPPAGLPNQVNTAFTLTSNGVGVINFYRNQPPAWDAACSQNVTYTFSAYIRAASTVQTFFFQVAWYDASNTFINYSIQPATFVDTSTGWTRLIYTVTSPSLAARFLAHVLTSATPANGEVHYISCIQAVASPVNITYCDTISTTWGQGGAISASGDNNTSVKQDSTGIGYVKIPNTPALQSSVFSFEMWVNAGALQGTQRCVCFGAWGDNTGWVIDYGGTSPSFLMYDGTTFHGSPTATAARGVWHHFVLTYDGTTGRFYIDGVLGTSAVMGYAPSRSANPNALGGRGDGAWSFNGNFDEAAFYNYVLSPAQVAAHYTAGTTVSTAPPPTPDKLVEWALSNGSEIQVVEQDTPEHVMSCEMMIVSCPLGFRDDRPEFGWPWPELQNMPLDLSGLEQALERFEPRGDADITQYADLAASVVTANVDVLIKEG